MTKCHASITQYGVQTPHSSTVLIVTTDRAQAEDALQWIHDGHVVTRTITTTTWQINGVHPQTG